MDFQGEMLRGLDVEGFIEQIYKGEEHEKRVKALAHAALGVISNGSLIVHRIGQGMARAFGLLDKHAIKQVDRLLSNDKVSLDFFFERWVKYIVGSRPEIKVVLDWTDFAKEGHKTLQLSLTSRHGRATPLLWATVLCSELKFEQRNHERALLEKLKKYIGKDIKVTVLADRGFADVDLFLWIKEELGFDYIIRFRQSTYVFTKGERHLGTDLIPQDHTMKTLHDVELTNTRKPVGTVVFYKAEKMKAAWCIAASDNTLSGSGLVQWYSKRWGIEPQFRDTKDLYLGMGLGKTSIRKPIRRDRLLMIHAIVTGLLTLLGAAGEEIGLDKMLKANTEKRRTISLFKQGVLHFNKLGHPRLRERYKPLIEAFNNLLEQQQLLKEVLLWL